MAGHRNRDRSIDIAKGIGILSVILGHCGVKFVSAYHMALFMTLSGYFMSEKRAVPEYAHQRARQLLIPYCFGVLFSMLGSVIRNLIRGAAFKKILTDAVKWLIAGLYGQGTASGGYLIEKIGGIPVVKIGAFWFLLAVFMGSMIVRSLLGRKEMLPVVALCAYIGVRTKDFAFLPWSVQPALIASFFIGMGWYIHKYDLFSCRSKTCFFAAAALWAFSVWQDIRMGFAGAQMKDGLIDVIVAFAAIYVIMKFSRLLAAQERLLLSRFLDWCGENSLLIFFWHALEINLFRSKAWGSGLLAAAGISETGAAGVLVTALRFLARVLFAVLLTALSLHLKPMRWIFGKNDPECQKPRGTPA